MILSFTYYWYSNLRGCRFNDRKIVKLQLPFCPKIWMEKHSLWIEKGGNTLINFKINSNKINLRLIGEFNNEIIELGKPIITSYPNYANALSVVSSKNRRLFTMDI